jgi:glycosyltransferase involved in cell wall biosynthesis
MPIEDRISFCFLGGEPDEALREHLAERLRARPLGDAEVLVLGGLGELGAIAAQKPDSHVFVVLDEGLVPSAEWLAGLEACHQDFDILTSWVREQNGGRRIGDPGEAGTVIKAYGARAICREDVPDGEALADRCQRFGFRVSRLERGELASCVSRAVHERATDPELGFNVFGFLSGNLGLGVAARHYLRNFMEAGLTVQAIDIPACGGRAFEDDQYRDIAGTLHDEAPHPINVFILNPFDLAPMLGGGFRALHAFDERINVCVPFWELPRIPSSWIPMLNRVDIVLAASAFIKYALLADLSSSRVRYMPLPAYVEPGEASDRQSWGLPEGTVVFISAFEMASDLNRKNPYAAIEAFNQAFTPSDDVILLIKLNNSGMAFSFDQHMETLRERTSRNPRIILVDEVLDHRDVLSLFAAADVFVSLHRAEGLGLPMLEAMSLGKPVIATAWSGNVDFMNEQNACLVGYDFVPVQGSSQAAYDEERLGAAARWADPRVDEAAAWMRRLADDGALRQEIGKRAAADLAERQRRINPNELVATVRNIYALRRARER